MDDSTQDTEQAAPKEKLIGVVEIFGPTIQGEGPLAGSKTMFVRFAGCDYRCAKCDSLHAVIPGAIKKYASRLTVAEIVEELVRLRGDSGTVWVVFSGGNPLMWDLDRLCDAVHEAGFAISVETQGTLWDPWLYKTQMVIISPKSPGMGEKFEPDRLRSFLAPLTSRGIAAAIKVVIFSAQDIEFALHVEEVCNPTQAPPGENIGVHLITPGMMFMSLGNPYPPILDPELNLIDNPDLEGFDGRQYYAKNLKEELLTSYRILAEEICQDGRLTHWRFLPQLHVLAWGNEQGK